VKPKFIFLILLLIFFGPNLFSQTENIKGTVKDKETHQPLAFVNIVTNNGF